MAGSWQDEALSAEPELHLPGTDGWYYLEVLPCLSVRSERSGYECLHDGTQLPAWLDQFRVQLLVHGDPVRSDTATDRIMHAIEYANCWPQGVDGAGIERQIGTANSRERSITFNAIAFENDYITYLAMKIAESLQIHKARYTMAPPPHSEIDESIAQIGIFQDAAVRVPSPARRNDNSLVWGFVPNGDKLDDSMPRTGVRTPESNGTAVAQSDKVEQWGPVNNTPFTTKNDSTMISGGATGAGAGQA